MPPQGWNLLCWVWLFVTCIVASGILKALSRLLQHTWKFLTGQGFCELLSWWHLGVDFSVVADTNEALFGVNELKFCVQFLPRSKSLVMVIVRCPRLVISFHVGVCSYSSHTVAGSKIFCVTLNFVLYNFWVLLRQTWLSLKLIDCV